MPRLSPLIFRCVLLRMALFPSQPATLSLSAVRSHHPTRPHASTNRRNAGPRSTQGPTISQCFCHHPCNDVLVSPTVLTFSPEYRIFLRCAWNLHECSAHSRWSGSAVSNVAQETMHLLGCNAMLQILGRQWNVYNATSMVLFITTSGAGTTRHAHRPTMAAWPFAAKAHSFPSW